MSDTTDIDIDAERKAYREWRIRVLRACGMYPGETDQRDTYRLDAWFERARIAAEREREMVDLLADAQHAVCCCSCPELEEGEPDRHCETCVRIGEALTMKGPSNER